MSSPVIYFFQLVLGLSPEFSSNITNKHIGFSQAFFEKSLGHRGKLIALHTSFMLLQLIKDMIFQEFRSKGMRLWLNDPAISKRFLYC